MQRPLPKHPSSEIKLSREAVGGAVKEPSRTWRKQGPQVVTQSSGSGSDRLRTRSARTRPDGTGDIGSASRLTRARPVNLESAQDQDAALAEGSKHRRHLGVASLGLPRLRFADRRVALPGGIGSGFPASWHRPVARQLAAEALGIAGLLAYNWWVLVPLKPGMMTSPNELFSDLEVPGQPFATAMQHADVLSGLLLLGAFLVVGSEAIPRGRAEWRSMMVFACAGVIAGLFPEACPDGMSAACRHLEWTFQLPSHHYVHIVASVFEFGGVTTALWLAHSRTRGEGSRAALVYRTLTIGALPAYLLLGAAYLFNIWGGVMEAVFFVAFTLIVLTELVERSHRIGTSPSSSTPS